MRYFEQSDGVPERIGKVIGDLISLAVVISIIVLVVNQIRL